ncbi:MAG: hypothetical protein GDYSWBUE_002109, partial [Candidatus Fervidibacterota bacterium]
MGMLATALMGMLLIGTALAAMPDREPRFSEWGYRPPDGNEVVVNPPSLTWVHDREAVRYIVQLATKDDFSDAITV